MARSKKATAFTRLTGAAVISLVLGMGMVGAQGVDSPPPAYTWDQVLTLIQTPSGPLDQVTVEKVLGIRMTRGTQRASDNYVAGFSEPRYGKLRISVALDYYPVQKAGGVASHHSALEIYLPRSTCITPEQLDSDFSQRGIEVRGTKDLSAHTLQYSVNGRRIINVISPGGSPSDVRPRLPHAGGSTEPTFKRCVMSLRVDESD
ncbi:hypothetical protein L2Y96_19625 [Luteibacter aegosomaticola]|uniref:hypothetical protein n=1 Tax=Luteibacter aegosomaticola TaxID=2911538 RepID=UPI001FF98206|nr:hypothetical protein [Luteibacter aegosomaticola]UPG89575.1 hypothetical protein L2Y96_19625 [Luteibacter aegosomaticola]